VDMNATTYPHLQSHPLIFKVVGLRLEIWMRWRLAFCPAGLVQESFLTNAHGGVVGEREGALGAL